MRKEFFTYFMANQHNEVLYIGVTNDIIRRVAEHKAQINEGFTTKYNCNKLVYHEEHTAMPEAIIREKQLKKWRRAWKDELIEEANPTWRDLSEEIGVSKEFVKAIKEEYRDS